MDDGMTSDDFDPQELYPAIEEVMADDDAADPFLDQYQEDIGR